MDEELNRAASLADVDSSARLHEGKPQNSEKSYAKVSVSLRICSSMSQPGAQAETAENSASQLNGLVRARVSSVQKNKESLSKNKPRRNGACWWLISQP
ncbi:hypothetical protein AJ75_04403 [Pseudomonas aeruginosa BWH035]|nr:hypothetical protein Q084_01019 [Pseudomonas aeruginosa M9A.1]EZN50154.1 hypothetical protein AJ75_04403 [Pseudomonas aeruginosa BWH035]RCM44651.1 hypothetical protein PA171_00373 [Pseudomonas aeruginosa]WBI22205.1 hypothetical protein PALA22_05489 [Pseudomonas aeruginosa]CAI9400322.1 hypothetical protein LGHFLMMC_00372 [Pseudomonas sp. T2.1D-1.1]